MLKIFAALRRPKFYYHYAFWTCAITAGVMGSSIDEGIYRKMGLEFLRNRDFSVWIDHPPFFTWFGSILPYLVAPEFTQLYRLSNILVFVALLIVGYQRLSKKYGESAGFIFLLLFAFCPNFKAHAAIHGNDFIVSALISFSAIWIVTLADGKHHAFKAAVTSTLAVLSKISAGFFVPFALLGGLLTARKQGYPLKKLSVGILFGALFGILLAYQFQIYEVKNILRSIEFQLTHNKGSHTTYFMGQIRGGVWWYYLLLFPIKLPLLHLLAVLSAAYYFLKGPKKLELDVVTLVPALALMVVLSRLNVQLGFRYFLPGLGLIYVWTAIQLSSWVNFESLINFRSHRFPLLISAAFFALVVDAKTLLAGSYISYFNVLAPTPTRNFSDSNIDWGGGLPEHLKGLTLSYKDIDKPLELLKGKDPLHIRIGASELNGHWGSQLGLQFKNLRPNFVLAGYEFFRVNRSQLFEMMWQTSVEGLLPLKTCDSDDNYKVETLSSSDGEYKVPYSEQEASLVVLKFESDMTVSWNGQSRELRPHHAWLQVPVEGLSVKPLGSAEVSLLKRTCR